ncbi:MAG: hypothetical protein LBJ77_01485 [Holosporales bacterium]|nr:hypothetical protein [Holosporales bacterium]
MVVAAIFIIGRYVRHFSCAILFLVIIFMGFMGEAQSSSGGPLPGSFQALLDSFSVQAKEFNKKPIPPEEAQKLLISAKAILDGLKKMYITDKLGVSSFTLQYPDGKEFPDPSAHNTRDEYDGQIIRFTIAIFLIYNNLTDAVLLKIIEKSPLELVSLLREINVYLQYISANPKEFGHGVFTEKRGDQLVVFSTDGAILRIMRVLVIKDLLPPNGVFKLSRITSAVIQNFPGKKPDVAIEEAIANMKRGLADDSRFSLFAQYELLGSMMSDPTGNPSDFSSCSNEYVRFMQMYQKETDPTKKQSHLDVAKGFAMTLLGLPHGARLVICSHIDGICKTLTQRSQKLAEESQAATGNEALKKKRESEHLEEISKFLMAGARILEDMSNDPASLDKLMMKGPGAVIQLAREIVVMLRVLSSFFKNNDDIDSMVGIVKGFATYGLEGTYLLSSPLSVAMNLGQEFTLSTAMDTAEFLDKSKCRYLNVR